MLIKTIAFAIVLGVPNLTILPVEVHHVETAVDFMEKFSILPRDAIHLSIMNSIDCKDIATADADFDRVDSINRWTPLTSH